MPAEKKVAWVSSVYGGYDMPTAPAEQDHDAEYVLVTDRPYECPPWRVVVEPRPQLHPRLAAKVAKCRPDAYADADVYIWTDANVRVADPGFVSWCAASTGDAQIALTRHPDAADIAGDLDLSVIQPRYASLPLREQAAHYAKEGFPEGYGHWWAGLIVRQGMDPAFGDAWLGEIFRWTCQDQISLPYLLWRHQIRPAGLQPGWLAGKFGFAPHGPEC